jgi:acyl-CoA dehydrogenase
VIGGSLKRREKISARLGDVLSMLYMTSAVIKRYHDEGRQKDDLPLLTWALYDSFFKLQVAMDGVLANFPNRFVAAILRILVFPKGLTLTAPSDRVGSQVAQILITPGAARDRLTEGAYIPRREDDVIGRLDFAMEAAVKAEPMEQKLRRAVREGKVAEGRAEDMRAAALKAGILTQDEHDHLAYAERLRRDVIKVDDFDAATLGRIAMEGAWQQPDSKRKAVAASL